MDKSSKSTDSSDYIFAGLVGAVAGAVGAIVATAMLDKEDRRKLGENLINISEKVLQRLNNLNKTSDSKQIPSQSSK